MSGYIATSERQKQYLVFNGMPQYRINVIRIQDVEDYLAKEIEKLPKAPPQQMELYFEGFNWWWYDEGGCLHPNHSPDDADYPLDVEDEYDLYDDDIPF